MSLSKYQSAVIHNESIRMLRRPSKTSIIDDVANESSVRVRSLPPVDVAASCRVRAVGLISSARTTLEKVNLISPLSMLNEKFSNSSGVGVGIGVGDIVGTGLGRGVGMGVSGCTPDQYTCHFIQ